MFWYTVFFTVVVAVPVLMIEFDRRFSCGCSARNYYVDDFPRMFLGIYNTLLHLISDARPILPLSCFPHHHLLQGNWERIKEEMLWVYRNASIPALHEVVPTQSRISDKRWKVFILQWYKGMIPTNCELCPFTVSLIAQIPELHLAMFSILEPHKHIPEHKGVFKGCLRYHLGLAVPKNGKSYIEVNGQSHAWREGEGFLFDDTYRHQVVNDTDEVRVVLFCDIERPLPFPFNKLNRLFNRHVVGRTEFVKRANDRAEIRGMARP